MELKTKRAVITAAMPAQTPVQEQGLELDYVLPDYYPDVCKLVRCMVTPTITAQTISGGRISYELRALIRILYCSEDSHLLQCVTQTLHFSRTLETELPDGSYCVEITPVTDYVNCRAVSRRRLDVRGAVTVKLRIQPCTSQEAICDIPEKSVQCRRIPVEYPESTVQTTGNVVISEDLELGTQKPPVLHIIRCDAVTLDESHKQVSGKLMTQGTLEVRLLYACEKDGESSLELMSFRLPYSKLLETENLLEEDHCHVRTTVAACDIKPVTDAEGNIRILRLEAELRICCNAVRMATQMLVCDAFSTEHQSVCSTAVLSTGGIPEAFAEPMTISTRLSCEESEPVCVYDAWCEVKNLSGRTDEQSGELLLGGMLCCYVLVREPSGMPRLLEHEEPFEHRMAAGLSGHDSVQVNAVVEDCAYTLTGQSEVSLKTHLRLEGMLRRSRMCEVLTDFEVQEDAAHPRNHALKLYFGKAQEEIWEIAKRCRTSVSAIMEENDLTGELLTEDGMLLIPIVN